MSKWKKLIAFSFSSSIVETLLIVCQSLCACLLYRHCRSSSSYVVVVLRWKAKFPLKWFDLFRIVDSFIVIMALGRDGKLKNSASYMPYDSSNVSCLCRLNRREILFARYLKTSSSQIFVLFALVSASTHPKYSSIINCIAYCDSLP